MECRPTSPLALALHVHVRTSKGAWLSARRQSQQLHWIRLWELMGVMELSFLALVLALALAHQLSWRIMSRCTRQLVSINQPGTI